MQLLQRIDADPTFLQTNDSILQAKILLDGTFEVAPSYTAKQRTHYYTTLLKCITNFDELGIKVAGDLFALSELGMPLHFTELTPRCCL